MQQEMKNDVSKFIDYWIPHVDEVCISPSRPMGSRISQVLSVPTKRTPCYMLYEMMVVCWDGQVGLCCEDWQNEGKIGNVSKDPLLSIWRSQKFQGYRQKHENEQFSDIPLCKECDSWYRGESKDIYDKATNCEVSTSPWQKIYRRKNKHLLNGSR